MPSATKGRDSTTEGLTARWVRSIGEIGAGAWDTLFAGDNPFLRHAFLSALEESGSVGPGTGWMPGHLVWERAGRPVGALPVYRKDHSYGEFVFDWGWAQAWHRHGLDYYPKLLTAVPFTPSAGPRVGWAPGEDPRVLLRETLECVRRRAEGQGCSGWHLLFPDAALNERLAEAATPHELLPRSDVQFHWRNRGYEDFDAFLATLRSSRRKTIRRERRAVAAQGVAFERLEGAEIGAREWAEFYRCYTETYLKRSGHGGYLNRDFFERLLSDMPEDLMLVVAKREGEIIANSLFFHDKDTLYGRYWGCLNEVRFLHFETCFYQGIEYCIERQLKRFDPGTQGEHKLLRGFEPTETHSWHWIADVRFRRAIAEYLQRERQSSRAYAEQAKEYLPFRRDEARG